MDNKLELLSMREQLMENVDSIVDGIFGTCFPKDEYFIKVRDEIVTQICDNICETLDPIHLD